LGVEYLSGDLDALVTGGLDNFVVGISDHGEVVEGVTYMFNHSNTILRPIGPDLHLLDKKPVVYAAIRDGHTCSNLAKVSALWTSRREGVSRQEDLTPCPAEVVMHV
jgi:hypothetical protein